MREQKQQRRTRWSANEGTLRTEAGAEREGAQAKRAMRRCERVRIETDEEEVKRRRKMSWMKKRKRRRRRRQSALMERTGQEEGWREMT